MNRLAIVTLALLPAIAPAASFSLGAVLSAGGIGQDELFLGSTSASPAASTGLFPFWLDSVNHNFQLIYNGTTNTATLIGDWLGLFTSPVNWNVVGGSVTPAPRVWTINTGGIKVTAANNSAVNTSVSLTNLSISGPGFGVINPPSITAAQTGGGTVTAGSASAITFTTPSGLGSWVLNGTIQFAGLASVFGGSGAAGNDLRAAFDIAASDVPEPESLLLTALGFAALGALHHHRQSRNGRLTQIPVSILKRPPA